MGRSLRCSCGGLMTRVRGENFIPTTSLDQYAATMGGWFGVPDAELRTIFPNLANFTPQRLTFMG